MSADTDQNPLGTTRTQCFLAVLQPGAIRVIYREQKGGERRYLRIFIDRSIRPGMSESVLILILLIRKYKIIEQ